MKARKYFAKAIVSVLVAVSLFATPEASGIAPGTAVAAEAASVKISRKKVTLGQGKTLTLFLKKGKKKVRASKWNTTNASVATVTSRGEVKAIRAGTAKIQAVRNGKTYTCKVTVRGLTKGSLTLTKGQAYNLSLKNLTKSQKKKVRRWTTSNKRVVSITKLSRTSYKLTAKGAGTARVTAKVGSTKFTCTVTVKAAGSTISSSTSSSAATHTHTWTAVTKQVQTGTKTVVVTKEYEEPVYEEHAVCNVCGKDYHGWTDAQIAADQNPHMDNHEGSGWHTESVLVNTIHHDAVVCEEPVYTTVTSYVCPTCGAAK